MIHQISSDTILDPTRGVHCSPIAKTESRRIIDFSTDISKFEWKRSCNDDNKEHMPTYTMHNLNVDSFGRSAEEFKAAEIIEQSDTDSTEEVDEQQTRTRSERGVLLSVLREKRKSLPSSLFVANNHILINNDRTSSYILPLIRCPILDKAASDHAKHMSAEKSCTHSDIDHLASIIKGVTPWRRIGENVCCGESIGAVHNEIKNNPLYIADRNNMFDRRFSMFGVGFGYSDEGKVYICQIYQG